MTTRHTHAFEGGRCRICRAHDWRDVVRRLYARLEIVEHHACHGWPDHRDSAGVKSANKPVDHMRSDPPSHGHLEWVTMAIRRLTAAELNPVDCLDWRVELGWARRLCERDPDGIGREILMGQPDRENPENDMPGLVELVRRTDRFIDRRERQVERGAPLPATYSRVVEVGDR